MSHFATERFEWRLRGGVTIDAPPRQETWSNLWINQTQKRTTYSNMGQMTDAQLGHFGGYIWVPLPHIWWSSLMQDCISELQSVSLTFLRCYPLKSKDCRDCRKKKKEKKLTNETKTTNLIFEYISYKARNESIVTWLKLTSQSIYNYTYIFLKICHLNPFTTPTADTSKPSSPLSNLLAKKLKTNPHRN